MLLNDHEAEAYLSKTAKNQAKEVIEELDPQNIESFEDLKEKLQKWLKYVRKKEMFLRQQIFNSQEQLQPESVESTK